MDEHKGIHLTQEGMKSARSVMRRHMLTEWMLVRMLSWSRLHAEAHEIEHAISEDVAAALQEQLSSPEQCPHGNPFPGYEETVSKWLPLTEIQPGEQVIIRRIHEMAEENHDLLSFLEQKGIMPGHQGVVEEVLPFNQTITLGVDKQSVTLGFATARYIFVERIE
jgi:DtxR family Mn-dependent transcriptional regulator